MGDLGVAGFSSRDVTQSRRYRGQRVKDADREATEQARSVLDSSSLVTAWSRRFMRVPAWMYLWNEWDPSTSGSPCTTEPDPH